MSCGRLRCALLRPESSVYMSLRLTEALLLTDAPGHPDVPKGSPLNGEVLLLAGWHMLWTLWKLVQRQTNI